ncbi:MAG: transporter, partial [Flavobacteriaceae bacterium]
MSLFILGFLFSICGFSQYTDIINSNKPGNSTGAYSVGKRVYQIESGFSVDRLRGEALQSESLFNNGNLAVRVGLFSEALELIYEGSYTMEFSTSPIRG